MKKIITLFIGVLIVSGCVKSTKNQDVVKEPVMRLSNLASEYLDAFAHRYPRSVPGAELRGTAKTSLFDNSLTALVKWQEKEEQWLESLIIIKKSYSELGDRDKSLLGLMEYKLTTSKVLRACKNELWDINHYNGWHIRMKDEILKLPLETKEQQSDALKILESLPLNASVEIDNMRNGISQGFVAPKALVGLVIDEIEGFLEKGNEDGFFLDAEKYANNKNFLNRWLLAEKNTVKRSYEKYLHFLKDEYLEQARESISLTGLPGTHGERCYKGHLKRRTSSNISLESIHDLGGKFEKKILKETLRIIKKLYNLDNMKDFYKLSNSSKEFVFSSKSEALELAEFYMKEAKRFSKNWFYEFPKLPIELKEVPLYEKDVAPLGRYTSGSLETGIPAKFELNVHDYSKVKKYKLPNLVIHEAIPGHHMQFSSADEFDNIHPLNSLIFVGAFAEGWAIYTEMIADEARVLQEEDRLGFLVSRVTSYKRTETDIGIHSKGWSIDEAIDFQVKNGWSERFARLNAYRFAAMPAQTISYLVGSLEIMALRDLGKKELGENFDIKEFHAVVLNMGNIPLGSLREVVEKWISSKKRKS